MITSNFDCSTTHITKKDDERIKASVDSNEIDIIAYPYAEGYFIFVSEDEEGQERTMRAVGYSNAFINLVTRARKNGCKYLQLDCDGTIYEQFPTFDW